MNCALVASFLQANCSHTCDLTMRDPSKACGVRARGKLRPETEMNILDSQDFYGGCTAER